MKILECNEPNNNVDFLCNIINRLDIDNSKYKWAISDLDLIPVFHGDYNGIGGEEKESMSYKFLQKIEREGVVVLDRYELYDILEDTQTIRNGVFICLQKQHSIDVNTYRPKVERDKAEELYDNRAECEIRILDGGCFLFYNAK